MDFLLTVDSTVNTTLSLPSGTPVYEITTPLRTFRTHTTTIRKYEQEGGDPHDIGIVELHSLHKDVCQLRGKDFLPKKPSMLNLSSFSFTSSKGEEYTWHRKSDTQTVLNDKNKNAVATYEQSHAGLLNKEPRPAKLSVSAEVMEVADEIVCTFTYVKQKEEIRKRTARGSAATSAATSAVVVS
ncbi:hypothetical protein PQX77_019515 [Marasmius sp. AFHP31]|nr:hypothetical protein PQX77_019515 [Marasmius sp. AFHP31]